MKALTLHQPWASAIAFGFKEYETRPRKTSHRGLLAIHAGKTTNEEGLDRLDRLQWNHKLGSKSIMNRHSRVSASDLPTGCIVAIAELVDCLLMDGDLIGSISDQERSLGDWEIGRYAYRLANIQPLPNPVAVAGKQGMWNWEPQDGELDGLIIE